MRSWFGQALVAVVLVAAGLMLWRAGALEQRIAMAERELVTLRYQGAADIAKEPVSALAALLPGEAGTIAAAKALQVTADYWQADYDAVAANPEIKTLAANAAYRATRRDGGQWQTVVGRLDSVVKSYAEVLRDNPESIDAAFNYEYAVRLRAAIAARKQPVAPVQGGGATVTIHGREGAPPAESEMKKFKMIVPMRPDERMEAERAGKAGQKVRKG